MSGTGSDEFSEFWQDTEELRKQSRNDANNANAQPGKAQAESSHEPSPDAPFPVMAKEAYYGLAGEIVRTIEPHTESHPAQLLLTAHVYFGNAIGRGPRYTVENTAHYTNLNALFVGPTGKGRKGTADGRIRHLFYEAAAEWMLYRIKSGLSSGEGLIEEVRDQRTRRNKAGEEEIVDPGVDDKRLLIVQTEFSGAFHAMKREGSILSTVMRDAWDGRPLATLVKHSPTRATGAHISIIGHITDGELRYLLDSISMANGFGNRYLFACVRRSDTHLPFGGDLSTQAIAQLGVKTAEAIECARQVEEVKWAPDGRRGWVSIYSKLSEGKPGLLGALTARSEAQVVRLAMIYALWDGKGEITLDHLIAAQAVWQYCDDSIRYIFGDSTGNPIADTILAGLKRAGVIGLKRTEISALFSRNESAGHISQALSDLAKLGLAFCRRGALNGAGRPPEIWFYVDAHRE